MINKITKEEYNLKYKNYIYPKIKLNKDTNNVNEFINLETYVKIKEYIIPVYKQISYSIEFGLYHRGLMQLVDGLMTDINRLKKNFKLEDWENNKPICYKLIE